MINTFKKLVEGLKKEASIEPNCREQLYPDIYELNSRPDISYWAFCITPNTITSSESFLTANLNLFFVDRLSDSKDNHLEIQSNGIQSLTNIVNRFSNNNPEVEIGSAYFTPFYQRFNDECSGVYLNINISFPSSVCLIGEQYE